MSVQSPQHISLPRSTGPVRASARLRRGAAEDSGFTLIEILVVILIIGVLAAIAIPSFFGQKAKAVDAQAKELVRTGETTAEAVATDNGGSYTKVSAAELNSYEPSIRIKASTTDAYVSAATGGEHSYTITATASNGDEYTISKSGTGVISRQCVSPVSKTGCSGGPEASW